MIDTAYTASADTALSGNSFDGRRGFVAVVLRGKANGPFPPNVIHKRLSRKAYPTQKEARAAASAYIEKNSLPLWSRPNT